MLPLDKLSEAAVKALTDHGLSPDDMTIALQMDLDFDGKQGESWLIYCHKTNSLIRLIADVNSIPKATRTKVIRGNLDSIGKQASATSVTYLDTLDLSYYSDMIVDTLISSNRVLITKHSTPQPDFSGMSDEEKCAAEEKWGENSFTEIIGFSTNTKRQRMFAFRDIIDRLQDGETVTDEDKIFDQFYAKCPKCGKVYDDQRRKVCSDCSKSGHVLLRILEFFLPYKWHILFVFLCMMISTGISLINPLISNTLLIDKVIDKDGEWHSLPMLAFVLSLIVGIWVFSIFIHIMQQRASTVVGASVGNEIKQKIFRHMMRLSLGFFNKNGTGNCMRRLEDSAAIQNFYTYIPHFIIQATTFVGLFFFLFYLNPKLTLIVIIPIPLMFLIFKFALPKLNRLHTKRYRAESSVNRQLDSTLSAVRVVKAFSKEAEETNRFHKYSERLFELNLKTDAMTLTIFPLVGLLIGMSSQAIWGIGSLAVMGETMTYGEFSAYVSYASMIFGPLNWFSSFSGQLTSTINAANRIFEVFDSESDVREATDAVSMPSFKGDIVFKDVNFHYEPSRPILKNVNIKINAGDNIGLVGHTGSGKSTIANLITRMYDTVSGTITIDGVDIRNIDPISLHRNIAIVSQEIFLFYGTIADNIRYARPDATMEEVIAAAKAANAHDFIIRMPQGYETHVGTGMRSLSGGEKQRVSIARALLMSPSILILDEATAAMDTETERMISDALAELVKGRTCISIAHRLSTLKDCNYLFAIEDGKIAEEGTPEELFAKKGVYYKLYTLQSMAMKKVLSGM